MVFSLLCNAVSFLAFAGMFGDPVGIPGGAFVEGEGLLFLSVWLVHHLSINSQRVYALMRTILTLIRPVIAAVIFFAASASLCYPPFYMLAGCGVVG
jgi:hypothetical protein